MDNSILREIKDEARKDKISNFLTKNKKNLLIIAGILFAALVTFFIYDYVQTGRQKTFSKIYHQAIIKEEKGDYKEATKLLKSIYESGSAPAGIKALASLRYAAAVISENKTNKALEIYEEIAFTGKYDDYLQDLSGLLLAKLLIVNFDINPTKEASRHAIIKIKKVINVNRVFKLEAQEQLAILYIKLDKNDEARKILESISINKDGSQNLKNRISKLIKLAS